MFVNTCPCLLNSSITNAAIMPGFFAQGGTTQAFLNLKYELHAKHPLKVRATGLPIVCDWFHDEKKGRQL